MADVYTAVWGGIRAGLAASDRLVGRQLLGVWEFLADLAFSSTPQELRLPWWWTTGAEQLRRECPSFKFRLARQQRPKLYPITQATWLSLPEPALSRFLNYLYEGTGDVLPVDEAARLALLADPACHLWSVAQA